MKVSAWTKKVFAPVFSSSTASSTATTTPFNTNNHSRLNDNASIHSNMSFSASPSNIKKRLRLFGSTDSSTTNSSSSSLLNTIFFSHIRDRNASCPDIHKSLGRSHHQIDVSTCTTVVAEYGDKNDGCVTKEGEEERPTTTTIYYHPPLPGDAVTETPSTEPSLTSSVIKPQQQQQKKQLPSLPSSLVESHHELWYLRHIGRIPAASTSTPEVNRLPQQLPNLHKLHHEKDCKYAQRLATQQNHTKQQQRHTTLGDPHPPPPPPSKQQQQQHQQQQQDQSLSPSAGQFRSRSGSVPNNPPADKMDPILLASLPLAPTPSDVLKTSAQKTLYVAPPPPHVFAPIAFQVRRSSANYSKDDIMKKNKNNEKKDVQSTPPRAAPASAAPVPPRASSNSCHPLHSVNTIKRLRDSIRDMAKFASFPSSSASNPVVPPETEVPVAYDNNNDITSGPIATVDGACCPHNSPVLSSDIELTTIAPFSGTTKTTTTIAEAEVIVPPVSNVNNEHTVEQLIQMVDILAREVKLMKQQQQQINRSNRCSTSTSTRSSATFYSDITLSTSRNKNVSRSPSIVSLPLTAPVTSHPSLQITLAAQNNASLSTPSRPFENSSSSNNNNNARTPLRTSQPISLLQQASSSNPAVRRNSGNNRTLHSNNPSNNSISNNNNTCSRGRNMALLQNLPPPPSERPPSPPLHFSSSGDTSSREEQDKESHEHYHQYNNSNCDSSNHCRHPSLSSSPPPSLAPRTIAPHPRHPGQNPRNHLHYNPRHSASLYPKSRPSSTSSALLFPTPPTSPPFEPISTTMTSQTTIIPHLTTTTTGIIDTIMSHSTASSTAPPSDTTTIISTHSCSIATSANKSTIKKHRKGSSSLPVISFTPPSPPSTGLIPSMSTSTFTSTSMTTSISTWAEPPPPTLTSPLATFTRAFPATPSPLSRQIQVTTSPSSNASSSSSSPAPALLPCPTPLTPPMSPDELSPVLSIEQLLQPPPPPTTNDDISTSTHSLLSLTNEGTGLSLSPPFSFHQDDDDDSNKNQQQQPAAVLTGPPKRPPRPPHFSVDMKQVLSLMDSRLGSNAGRVGEAEYDAQAAAEAVASYIRQSASSSSPSSSSSTTGAVMATASAVEGA